MGHEDEELARRAVELKAKIAARNKEREERQAAGGAPAMALAAKEAEEKEAASRESLAEHIKGDMESKSVKRRKALQKKKPAKAKATKPAKKAKATSEVKMPKEAKAPKVKNMSRGPVRRTMDRDKTTGLRPIETQIIKICRKLKRPVEVRVLAEKLFGADEVLSASGAKDNKRLREVRNAVRVPIQKDLLRRAGSGMVVHKEFADSSEPISLAKKASSKARKVAKKATGKRA